jgi:hypothetical protein
MWEIKEKNTTSEVKLQYTIIKLDEKLLEVKSRLENFRVENVKMSELIKTKYDEVI